MIGYMLSIYNIKYKNKYLFIFFLNSTEKHVFAWLCLENNIN